MQSVQAQTHSASASHLAAPVTTLFVYGQSGQLIGEYDASGNVEQDIVWVNGIPVGAVRGGQTYAIHTDHLGTPRAITDSNGTVVWRWDGEPFGASAANDDPDGDGVTFEFNLRFPGQYYDAETGLDYNYYRDYDPRTGRYVESDPSGLKGGLNTYGYVSSQPTKFLDPTGLVLCGYADTTVTCECKTPTVRAQLNCADAFGAPLFLPRHYSDSHPLDCPKDRRHACLAAHIECGAAGKDEKNCEAAFNLCVRNPRMTVKFPDGTKVKPDGTIITPDGKVRRPDGSEFGP